MHHLRRFRCMVIAVGTLLPGVANAQASQPYALVNGSTFQRGCFAPCECAIGIEQPLTGTFALVPSSNNGTFAQYDMVDVHWEVSGTEYATPPDAPITGTGTYTVGGEFAVQQRLLAELQVANEPPAAFDSGLVAGGGGFPKQIDIEISRNGKYCFDTVMHVVATEAQPAPEPGATVQLLAGIAGLVAIAARRSRRRSSY